MKVSELASYHKELEAYFDINFHYVSKNNIELKKDSLFVAVEGSSWDGHSGIDQAIKNGAVFIVGEKDLMNPPTRIPYIKVKDSRDFYAYASSFFCKQPSSKLLMFGVTGTNGKTTTVYILEYILNYLSSINVNQNNAKQKNIHFPCGNIGTIDHHFLNNKWVTNLTSPDAFYLHSRLNDFVDLGAKACAMEVSSHALDQKRVDYCDFDVAIFTNLSQDHLDYHKDMDSYLKAKSRLFNDVLSKSKKNNKLIVLNKDDSASMSIADILIQEKSNSKIVFYGKNADLSFNVKSLSFDGMEIEFQFMQEKNSISIPLIGEHNAYNFAAALAALSNLENPLRIIDSLKSNSNSSDKSNIDFQVPGRLEKVLNTKGRHVFIDYAHTPDALQRVLSFLYSLRKSSSNKIYVVFGCGGDRDKEKRPLMAIAAEKNSDICVLTSDNPRSEKPEQIIEEAKVGFKSKNSFFIVDRREAIYFALNKMQEDDVLIVAGKGHETYQEIMGVKHFFSDKKVVEEYFSEQ